MTTSKTNPGSGSEPRPTPATLLAFAKGTPKTVGEAVTSGTLLTDPSSATTSLSEAERKDSAEALDRLQPLLRQAIADNKNRMFKRGATKVQVFALAAPDWWYNMKHKLGFHFMLEAWNLDPDMVLLDQWKECRVCGWKS